MAVEGQARHFERADAQVHQRSVDAIVGALYDLEMGAGDFRWNEWNLEHATQHGCGIREIESVARHPGRGFPRDRGNDNGSFKDAAKVAECSK